MLFGTSSKGTYYYDKMVSELPSGCSSYYFEFKNNKGTYYFPEKGTFELISYLSVTVPVSD